MKIKRGLALLLVLCLALSLAACGKKPAETTTTTTAGGDGDTVVTDTNGDVVADPTDDDTVVTDSNGDVVTDPTGDGTTGTTLKGQTTTTVATKSGGTTKTTRGTRTTGVIQTVATKVDKPFAEIEFKEGTKKFDEGLNFGGKTFTYAISGASLDDNGQRWKGEFEKEYNATVKVESVGSSEFWAKVAAKMIAKEPYDIVTATAQYYPTCVLSNALAPLEDYITTADLWDSDSYKEGGFSKSLAQGMSWDGHMYVAGGAYLAGPGLVYYNKKIWKEAGLEDPLTLYKAGKWTWDKYYEQLSNIHDSANERYGLSAVAYESGSAGMIVCSYDTNVFKMSDDGRMMQNLNDTKLYNALTMLKKFCYGNTAVTAPQGVGSRADFANGKVASLMGGAGWYGTLYYEVQDAAAFGKSTANLGAVPVPTASTSKVVPIWQWIGYGACNGTSEDGIMAALAYAKYDSKVNHLETYCEEMPDEIQKIVRGNIDSDNLTSVLYGFTSSAGSVEQVAKNIYAEVAVKGQPVSTVLKAYQKQLEKVIAAAVGAA